MYLNCWQLGGQNSVPDARNEMSSQMVCKEELPESNENEPLTLDERQDSSGHMPNCAKLTSPFKCKTCCAEYTRRQSFEKHCDSLEIVDNIKHEYNERQLDIGNCTGIDGLGHAEYQDRISENKVNGYDRCEIWSDTCTVKVETEESPYPINRFSSDHDIKTESSPTLFECGPDTAEFTQPPSYGQQKSPHLSNIELSNYAKQLHPFTAKTSDRRSLNFHLKNMHNTVKSKLNTIESKDNCADETNYTNDLNAKEIQRLFTCDYCGKNFKQKNHVRNHIVTHTKLHLYKCYICKSEFRRRCDLTAHLMIQHNSNPFKCNECPESFISKATLNRHIKSHTDAELFKCDLCGRSFTLKVYLRKHLLNHIKNRPFKCNTCTASFNIKHELKRHIVIHSDARPVQCDICGKCYREKRLLRYHLEIHVQTKPFKCNVCASSFSRKCDLNRHMENHNNDLRFKCHLCEKAFKRKQSRRLHLKYTHDNESKPIKCPNCPLSFITQYQLNVHIVSHFDAQPFKCDTCERFYKHKTSLRKHLKFHNRPKPFPCADCPLTFGCKSRLNSHIIGTHSGDRPFQCYVCKNKFKQKADLSKHFKIHNRPTQFQCNECPLVFATKSRLNYHIVGTHSNHWPFQCQVCDKHFLRNCTFTKHLKSHGERIQ